jgi:hypothetical protein
MSMWCPRPRVTRKSVQMRAPDLSPSRSLEKTAEGDFAARLLADPIPRARARKRKLAGQGTGESSVRGRGARNCLYLLLFASELVARPTPPHEHIGNL